MLCLIFALATGASTGVTFWAPFYVNKELGMNLANSAWVGAATINTAGFLSVPLGGLLADTLAKRTPIGRFLTLAIGLGLAGFLLCLCSPSGTAVGIGLVLVATSIAKGLFDGCIYAAMHDVVPPQGARDRRWHDDDDRLLRRRAYAVDRREDRRCIRDPSRHRRHGRTLFRRRRHPAGHARSDAVARSSPMLDEVHA